MGGDGGVPAPTPLQPPCDAAHSSLSRSRLPVAKTTWLPPCRAGWSSASEPAPWDREEGVGHQQDRPLAKHRPMRTMQSAPSSTGEKPARARRLGDGGWAALEGSVVFRHTSLPLPDGALIRLSMVGTLLDLTNAARAASAAGNTKLADQAVLEIDARVY